MMIRAFLLLILALIFAGVLAGPTTSQSDDSPVDHPFGIIEGAWAPEQACDLGASWERLIFDWSAHQPNGPDEFVGFLNIPDEWLNYADACNREVVAVVKNTPAWATDGTPIAGVPRGLHLPMDDPDNLWANFMRQTAAYYAPRGVNRYIIWNEPDIQPGTYGFEFEGTLEDYARMVEVAAVVMREVNPAVQINLGGTTYWHDINSGERLYTDRLLEYIVNMPGAAEHDYYFNALSLHIYFRTDTVYDIIRVYQRLLEKHGLEDKAIWVMETNASPNLDPDWPVSRPQFQITLDQQAAFLLQSAAQSLAAGAERIAAYKLYDQSLPAGAESFGLLVPGSQEPRPAFYTWQTISQHLTAIDSAILARNERVNVVRVDHHGDRQTLVTWARTDQTITLEITASTEKAYLIDQTGNQQVIRPVDGIYTLTLPGATCEDGPEGCVVGGQTFMLVQPAGELTITEVTPRNRYPLAFGEVESVAPQPRDG
jgi:hypothetical protein